MSHRIAVTNPVVVNPWNGLRQFTAARIALGRAGVSLPTAPQLAFQLAHAQARDAVHQSLNVTALKQNLLAQLNLPESQCLNLHSVAENRSAYLKRPDWGRRLRDSSQKTLVEACALTDKNGLTASWDLAFVVVDGLSALAIENNAVSFLNAAYPKFINEGLSIAPLTIVEQGRVAIGDEVGEILRAKLVVVMIGERPGLSSPDSMGLYMTWEPKIGLTDERRNCISNIHKAGMSYAEAVRKLAYLIREARVRQLTGVELKDETDAALLSKPAADQNFLLA